jgi:hypothetical protein
MADEMTEQTEVPAAAKPECHAVLPGGVCSACGWDWSSIEPHPVFFGQVRQEPVPEVAKAPARPAPAPDPKACAPIMLSQTCPTCGWQNGVPDPKTGVMEPHPVLAH